MHRQFMHVFCAVALAFFGFWGTAFAVSLGKVDVASHLGEPFYAEVPLNLDDGESIASVFVELASPSDYRILEVFRDGAVSSVRTDVKSDSRGSRVELTSVEGIESPFFNLVLKVRHGHATHFKKFAVFLDLPRAAQPNTTAKAEVLPVKTAAEIAKQDASAVEPTIKTEAQVSEPAFKAYDGWARTAKYGPMVFGDTITTVAQRLRVDDRYTNQQVMMALFERNKAKFAQDNINLIKAGTYLDVPSAKEVEQITPQQALAELKQHNEKWRTLTKQAKYARVQEAQQNRYTKRVRIGKSASGVASQPLATPTTQSNKDTDHTINDATTKKNSSSSTVNHGGAANTSGTVSTSAVTASSAKIGENSGALTALRQENADLQKRLQEMETQVAKLSSQPTATEAMAASDAKIKKLELQLARQSAALEKARKQNRMQDGGQPMGMLTWILLGIIALLVVIAGYLAYVLRGGQRTHPAQQEAEQTIEPEMDSVEEIEVEEAIVDEAIETGEYFPEEDESQTIPELTDEDTSEIEVFQGLVEDADPNVDYLAEADVYMRYGMEDEAEKQVRTALQLREDNKDAHIKLAQILHARGDKSGLEEAVKIANSTLIGGALASFTAAVDGLANEDTSDSEVREDAMNLDDTLLATKVEKPVVEDDTDIEDDALDMTDFELPDFSDAEDDEASVNEKAGVESNATEHDDAGDGLDFDLSDLEDHFDEKLTIEPMDEVETNIESNVEDMLDMGDFGDLDIDAETSVSDGDDVAYEAIDDKTEVFTVTESDEADDDFNLDLSGLELPEGDVEDEPKGSVASSFDTEDLDKTVVMSSSKGMNDIDDLPVEASENSAESMSDDISDFDFDDLMMDNESDVVDSGSDNETVVLNASSNIEIDDDGDMTASNLMSLEDDLSSDEGFESGRHVSSGELDLNDVDIDLSGVADDDLEEFSSTIQAELSDLGVDDSQIKIEKSDDNHEIDLDAIDLSLDDMESSDLLRDIPENDSDDSIDDLNIDLGNAEDDGLDKFTSSIEMVLSDLGIDDSKLEVSVSDDDMDLDAIDLSLDDMESSDLLRDIPENDSDDSIDDLNIDLELDDLLSDLDDEDDTKDKS